MAHGIPAIVVFLGKMAQQGTAGEKSLQLLNGAVEYILRQSLDREKYGCYFPARVVEGEHPIHSRLAWCYGDLGVSMALWQVSQVTGNKEWGKKAVDVLLYAAKRKNPGMENVADAGLCHGTAGIAHIYNRMFHSTGIEAFKETVEYWMRQTLRMATFDDGLAGYKKSVSPEKSEWENSASVLGGIAGIGLVLISAISDIEPKWDECLLLS
jgi:lantibiotic modifying enzyme